MPPSIALPTPSWAPPSTRIDDAVGVEGAEALAGDRAAVELEARRARRRWPPGRPRRSARGRSPRRARCRARGRWRRSARGNSLRTRAAASRCRRRARRSAPRPAWPPSGSAGRRPGRPRRAPRPASSATGRSSGSRSRNSSSGVISGARSICVLVRDLLEQVVAADQVLGAVVAERGDDLLDLLAHRLEEAGAALGGAVDLLRGELLQAVLLGLLDGLDLGRDADVAGVELAAAADRAAEARPSPGCRSRPGWRPGSAA